MKGLGRSVLEMGVLLAVASTAALGYNALRDRGLRLDKNYFASAAPPPAAAVDSPAQPAPNAVPAEQQAAAHTPQSPPPAASTHRDHIYQVATIQDALDMYNDPMYQQGYCFFIDARNQELFAEGRIRGARQLDPYYAEDYLPDLLPDLNYAERVIVYCEGGECEDSIFACRELLDAGIDYDRIFLFAGGMEEWIANDGPVESDR